MVDSFVTSFKLRKAYMKNSILFSLSSLPLIGKHFFGRLYGSKILAFLVEFIAVLAELGSIFLGKILYYGFMIYILSDGDKNNFINIFFFLTLAGLIINTYLFNPTKDKYYALNIFKMDAREYTLSNFMYFLLKQFIGALPVVFVCGLLIGLDRFTYFMIPVFVVCAKAISSACMLSYGYKHDKYKNENKPASVEWIMVIVLCSLAYGLVFIEKSITINFFNIIAIITAIASIFAFKYLFNFKHYKYVYKKILGGNEVIFNVTEFTNNSNKDLISSAINEEVVVSNNKGMVYFNEIFIKRHSKILKKSSNKMALTSLLIIISIFIGTLFSAKFDKPINDFILKYASFFVFIMYMINRGQVITNAMFMNCDHSMLTYKFFKKPKNLLKLFTERLKTIVKINLLPTLIIAIGITIILYTSGGTNNYINYIILPVSIICMSIFFSVHYLILYYLFQPFNLQSEIKSSTYSLITSGTYLVAYSFIDIGLPLFYFGVSLIAFTVLYIIIALFAVYKFAPKTFKLK